MSNLEPRIEAVRAKYGLAVEDFWQIKQNKQWVCKHAALEVVAVKAGIEWMPPMILEKDAPNFVTSMIVTGKMGDRIEWATGETNSTNYSVTGRQPAYPWAMSEKRAKDRVVLKLVGIHGLVYSEDEMPSGFEDREPVKSSAALKREDAWSKALSDIEADMVDVKSVVALDSLQRSYEARAAKEGWTENWKVALADVFIGYRNQLHGDNLWQEMTAITNMRGLKSFWDDHHGDIKVLGPALLKKFTAKKDEMKKIFEANASTLNAG